MRGNPRGAFRLGLAVTAIAVATATLAACAGDPGSPRPSSTGGHRQRGAVPDYPPALSRPGLTAPAAGPHYYLALGDSLAQGIQPGSAGADVATRSGYPQQLDAMLRRRAPGLRLVLMGCSGETTSTMIRGGICPYPRRSQLLAAVAFLRGHRGQVVLITIDIGANDPNSCLASSGLTAAIRCLSARTRSALRNLRTILSRLRSAAAGQVPVVGMTYYVPELALWRRGQTGSDEAVLTERLALGYGRMLTSEYRRFGARVADVFGAFGSADFRPLVPLRGHGLVPRNVAVVCSLTWMCADSPRGPNEHPNAAGYRLIARTFYLAITR